MALCVVMQTLGMVVIMRWLKRLPRADGPGFWPTAWMLIRISVWAVFVHLLQILVWALFYLRRDSMPDLAAAVYFSAVTYTTTGYGDLVLPPEWRLVGAIEALTGILMCGLSTGLFFAVVHRALGGPSETRP